MHTLLVLTGRELKSAFRETSVVLYSVLLPLLLYPFLLWLMVTAMTFIEGQQEGRIFEVAYHSDIEGGTYRKFLDGLKSDKRLQMREVSGSGSLLAGDEDIYLSASEADLRLEYVSSRPASSQAADYLEEKAIDFNQKEREDWFVGHDHSKDASRPFLVSGRSTAASGDVGGYLLGALLPIGLLVMIALGGAYPAIDTTAGERERGTWETLQTSGPSLSMILASKYLFVSVVCCISGLLNLFAMLVSIRSIIAPLLREDETITFSVGPQTMLVLFLGVVSVSFFVSAALMLCSIFARTFREGQALTTPMFMMIALPVLPLSDPSLQLNTKLAFVPLVNLALVWRQALQGEFQSQYIFQTLAVLGVMVLGALWFGARLLENESLMTGSGSEMSWRRFWSVVRGAFGGN